MSFLYEAGDLARTPLAAVLLEAWNVKATGTLTVDHGQGTSRLFLHAGVPVGAQVYVGFRPLGQFLLQEGLIDVEILGRSLAEMARSGRKQGEILLELGALSPEALEAALSRQQAAYVAQVAAADAGDFRFDPAAAPPEWTQGVRIAPLRVVLDALERPQAADLVSSALAPADGGQLVLTSAWEAVAGGFGFDDREASLVERLRTPQPLDLLLAHEGLSPARVRAIAAALLLLGCAEPRRAAAEAPPAPPAPPLSPAELEARRSDPAEARRRRQRLLARAMQNMGVGPLSRGAPEPAAAGGPETAATRDEAELRRALAEVLPRAREKDLFARLGVPRSAGRDAVKQAYLALAKRFHPDRFAAPALAPLLPQVKELFVAVNDAYEVLSDDVRRAEYLAAAGGGPGPAASAADRAAAAIDFTKGEACLRTRDYARARAFLEAAVRADPKPAHEGTLAWALLADPRMSPADRERARQLAASAARDPACDRGLFAAALLARGDDDLETAERLLRRALELNRSFVEAERELRQVEARRPRGPARKA